MKNLTRDELISSLTEEEIQMLNEFRRFKITPKPDNQIFYWRTADKRRPKGFIKVVKSPKGIRKAEMECLESTIEPTSPEPIRND